MANSPVGSALPREPIQRIVGPFERFLHVESAGGVVLLFTAIVALALANSPWSEAFLGFWKTRVAFAIGDFEMDHSLKHWINDGLMGIFFFVIGLEVKRELVLGELRDLRRAVLPLIAAVGGMVVPAGIYLALQAGEPSARGWGIPMATDIAFVVGILALLGSRIPMALRVMLLSLAIADDIGAILVIAIGYTSDLSFAWLAAGFAAMGVVMLLAYLGVRSIIAYVIVGGFVWLGFHESGVHATIAGVLLGLVTPAHSWIGEGALADLAEDTLAVLRGEGLEGGDRRQALRQVETAARETVSPLERLEAGLHPWVAFLIMPLFALANAGVVLDFADLADPVAHAVAAGLVIGKPLGIVGFSALAVAFGIARLPEGVGWGALTGGAFLAGIGFTMALFIADLALYEDDIDAAKVGILGASVVCGAIGIFLLSRLPARTP
ncbi:MAG: Na+/H+ antiporter NhaA [Myxococcota bacterium]